MFSLAKEYHSQVLIVQQDKDNYGIEEVSFQQSCSTGLYISSFCFIVTWSCNQHANTDSLTGLTSCDNRARKWLSQTCSFKDISSKQNSWTWLQDGLLKNKSENQHHAKLKRMDYTWVFVGHQDLMLKTDNVPRYTSDKRIMK